MPEPIEFDPFEMDWPWPGMGAAEPAAEPARNELTAPEPDEEAAHASSEQDAVDG